MMVGFVETTSVRRELIETLVDDNTIGALLAQPDEFIRGDVAFDLKRLQRAILAFEDEFGDRHAELAIVEDPDTDGPPALALVPHGGGHRAILLAPYVEDSDGGRTDADELVRVDGGEE